MWPELSEPAESLPRRRFLSPLRPLKARVSSMESHPRLRRQLYRLGLTQAQTTEPNWARLVALVGRTYARYEANLRRLQRTSSEIENETESDLSELYQRIEQLERAQELADAQSELSRSRLASVLELTPYWLWEQDATLRFTFFSAGIERKTGIAAHELLGSTWIMEPETLEHSRAPAIADLRLVGQAFSDITLRYGPQTGEARYCRASGMPLLDAQGSVVGYRGIAVDVTASVRSRQEGQQVPAFDAVTGLPNRVMLMDELERRIQRADPLHAGFAVCIVDLQQLESLTQTRGLAVGNAFLEGVAQRLLQAASSDDYVARLGASDFAIILGGDPKDAQIRQRAADLLGVMNSPAVVDAAWLDMTANLGVSLFPDDGRDANSLLGRAEAAVFVARERSGTSLQFYSAADVPKGGRDTQLEADLRQGIARGELVLHYQPIVQIEGGQLVGFEALVQWRHPTRGLLAPGAFIKMAEECGLMVPVGRWVVRRACEQLRDWREAGLVSPPVAINLSARQFISESLGQDLADAMAACGLSEGQIEIEFPESVLMADPEKAALVLQRLHSQGVRLSIDDFGTGYSSLAYLKRFPVQAVKVDRTFISGLEGGADARSTTKAVIAMAHALGLAVVAEGVETTAQLEALREMGCDEAQGYLLGRPIAGAELADWLRYGQGHHRPRAQRRFA